MEKRRKHSDVQDVQDGILKKAEKSTARGSDGKTAKEHLSSFFAVLAKIKPVDDNENDLSDYVNNDSDGVACRLASDLGDLQKVKVAKFEQVQRDIFPDAEEEVPSSDGSGKGAPVVSASAELNARGRYGFTRLIDAAAHNNIAEVKKLLALGADKTICDNWGKTAFDLACLKGYDEVCRLLDPSFVRTEPVPQLNFDDE